MPAGFLLKDAPTSQLTEAVRTRGGGRVAARPGANEAVIERYAKLPPREAVRRERFGELTDRELDVLELLTRALER